MGFQGGCACRAVRYTVSADPVAVVDCHCRSCQHFSGGGHSTAVVLPPGSIRIASGAPKGFASAAESGNTVTRYFCPECGASIYASTTSAKYEVVYAASLDDPSALVVGAAVHVSEAQPWAHIDPAKPQFPKSPPSS